MDSRSDRSLSWREGSEEYSRLFREAAARFRQSMTDDRSGLCEECGRWIIQSHQRGYLQLEPEERERIGWHLGDGSSDLRPGMSAVPARCPSNLFRDIAGGGGINWLNSAGKGTIIVDPITGTSRTGGIFTQSTPAWLNLPPNERDARACERLASRIDAERERRSEVESPGKKQEIDYDKIYSFMIQEKQGIPARLLRFMADRIVATHQEVLDGVYDGDSRAWDTIKTQVTRLNNWLAKCMHPDIKSDARRLKFNSKAGDYTVSKCVKPVA